MEIAMVVWAWILQHWKASGWVLAALLLFLLHSSNQKLATCKGALDTQSKKPVPEVKAEGKATGNQRVSVVYQKDKDGKSSPCPDVTVDNNTESSTQSAMKMPMPEAELQDDAQWGIELAGSFSTKNLYDPSHAGIGASVLYGPYRIGIEKPFDSAPRLQLAGRYMFR